MSSYLGAGKIKKILQKRKERGGGGMLPLPDSEIIIMDAYKGRPQRKKHNPMDYFQRETSYYKHHQGLMQKYQVCSKRKKKGQDNKFLQALSEWK